MYFEFLVQEDSAAYALEALLPKILGEQGAPHSWTIHSYEGGADFTRSLPKRLRGYAQWMPPDHRIVILVDEDRHDCHGLKSEVRQFVAMAGLDQQHVLIRIAIEELEAWYFGDVEALCAAYPRLPEGLPRREAYRDPDAIKGGTWEALDRELVRAGYRQGLAKVEAARLIAPHMDPNRNTSHSFQVFREGLLRMAKQNTRADNQ